MNTISRKLYDRIIQYACICGVNGKHNYNIFKFETLGERIIEVSPTEGIFYRDTCIAKRGVEKLVPEYLVKDMLDTVSVLPDTISTELSEARSKEIADRLRTIQVYSEQYDTIKDTQAVYVYYFLSEEFDSNFVYWATEGVYATVNNKTNEYLLVLLVDDKPKYYCTGKCPVTPKQRDSLSTAGQYWNKSERGMITLLGLLRANNKQVHDYFIVPNNINCYYIGADKISCGDTVIWSKDKSEITENGKLREDLESLVVGYFGQFNDSVKSRMLSDVRVNKFFENVVSQNADTIVGYKDSVWYYEMTYNGYYCVYFPETRAGLIVAGLSKHVLIMYRNSEDDIVVGQVGDTDFDGWIHSQLVESAHKQGVPELDDVLVSMCSKNNILSVVTACGYITNALKHVLDPQAYTDTMKAIQDNFC